jgi:two-component system, NarL family, sensor histidine kinase DegS
MHLEILGSSPELTPEAAKACQIGLELLQQSLGEARRLISGLRPPTLDQYGVVTALRESLARAAAGSPMEIEFRCDVDEDSRFAPLLENTIFRIVQEGVANSLRHSGAKRCQDTLQRCSSCLRIEIRDWGVGFDPEAIEEGHYGLEGLRERVRLLEGKFLVESGPERGTTIRVELPLLEREAPSPGSPVGR